jgi:hypothetical protein
MAKTRTFLALVLHTIEFWLGATTRVWTRFGAGRPALPGSEKRR